MTRLIILSMFLSSCAQLLPNSKAIYFADTAKKHTCDPKVFDESLVNQMLNPSVSDLKQAQDSSGYSDCTSLKPDPDSSLWTCKKPIPYSSFSTTKLANCHKFMADNKLN